MGSSLDELSARDVLDVTFALLADGYTLVDSHEIRDKVEKALEQATADRELWGMDADELDAMQRSADDVGQDGAP